MRLSQIRDFLAVIESGSISATARKLGVSQPGLTKSLGSLEAELGAAMLLRTPTGVTLTRQGHAFHVHARAGYAELAERLPGLTVGLHTRADAPLTRPAAALARLLSDTSRRLLQRA